MVFGSKDECGVAFGGHDGVMRLVSGALRIGVMSDFMPGSCFTREHNAKTVAEVTKKFGPPPS